MCDVSTLKKMQNHFVELYEEMTGRASCAWHYGIMDGELKAIPDCDNVPARFQELFRLTETDMNKGLDGPKWDRCFGKIRQHVEKNNH